MTDAQVVKGAEDSQDAIVFTGNTGAVEVKSGNPVTGLSGSVSDVVRVPRVNNSPSQSQDQYNAYALLKNSGALAHAASKIDWASAGAQGSTPGGQPSTGATYYVTFEYWRHTVEGDYVCSDSFLNDYEEVEYAPNGTWPLRDCIDFRTIGGVRTIPAESPRFDYEYYLSRLDKIVLRSDGYFERMPGIPADYPVPPGTPTGPLPVAVIHIPPYTYSPDDCIIQSLQVQRKTQQAMNEMATDIERAKYYNALYLAERNAVDNSAAADAKGIFVDPLVGQKMGDFSFDKHGVRFTAAIDPTEQCVRLPVGYGPGEYCFVMLTNCPSYYVWYAKTGQVDIRTGEVVRQQPAPGVMFTSPNNSYWQGNPDSDLMFQVLAANFENNAQVVFSAVSGIEANMLVAIVTQFLPESCNLHWMYSIDGGSNWVPFLIGVDTELGQIATAVRLRCDVTGSGGTFQISESGAGIILLLNETSAIYLTRNAQLSEPLDKVTMIVDLAVDGVNGGGTRSVTP